MKDVFCKFFKFFQKASHQRQGEQGQKAQRLGQVGQPVADFDRQAAEGEKVHRPARQQPCRPVQPDPAAPGLQGPQKQRPRHRHPEGQVQHSAQQGQPDPDAQHPEQVVQQPRGHPQGQGLQHCPALLGDRDAHA